MADGEPCGKEEVMIQVPAVISRGEEAPVQPGGLTVLVSTLEIQDSHNALLHRFRRADVDSVEVRSPYEVSIRQRFIGKPDVVYRVLSARMPEVIPILEVQFSEKVELPGDADTEGLGSSEAASQVAGTRPVWPTGEQTWRSEATPVERSGIERVLLLAHVDMGSWGLSVARPTCAAGLVLDGACRRLEDPQEWGFRQGPEVEGTACPHLFTSFSLFCSQ